MRTTIVRSTEGACDFYRATLPLHTAARHGQMKVQELWPQTIVADAMFNPARLDQQMDCDIVLIQRIIGLNFVRRIKKEIKERGNQAALVMDFDDNVFKISPLSGHYADYGTEDVKIVFPDGTEHWAWKDGENIDLAANRKRIDEVKVCLEMADLVTTTTAPLADVFRVYNDNVRILPNCIDSSQWHSMPLLKGKEIRLFWAGGMSHWEDLALIREPLKVVLERFPEVKLVIMGWMPGGFEETYPGRVEFHEWEETVFYPYKVASLNVDVGLIPLSDSEFNKCKSAIKWVEMSALGIPTAVSYVTPYREMAELSDKSVGLFVEDNDEEAWIEAISKLISNAVLRREVAEEARRVVLKNFDIRSRYHEWTNAYEECLSWQRQPTPR